jgi:hypothetical protein
LPKKKSEKTQSPLVSLLKVSDLLGAMTNSPPWLVLTSAVALGVGCAQGPTYARDVKPLVDARCATCHRAGGIGPFAMETYADVKATASLSLQAIEAGRMPPWKAGPSDVTYLHNPSLTAEQKATFAAWVKAGMPEGDRARPGTALPTIGSPPLDRADVTLRMPEAYTPTKVAGSEDDYRCFVLRWPETRARYVTGVNFRPDAKALVHHIAVYLVPTASARLPVQWDAEDTMPGYECFGGPFGGRPQSFPVGLLTAWVPGAESIRFPRGGGISVPPGATLIMQLHYSMLGAPPSPDQTKMELQLADQVDTVMAYQPFLDVSWVGGNMPIPAGQAAVVHEYGADPRPFFGFLGSPLNTSRGFNIEGVMFHMHTLGRHGELFLEQPARGDKPAQRTKILDVPAWDFNWQQEYLLTTPVRFEDGDKLRLKCTFDATGRTAASNWGEDSLEEMCVANLLSSE